MTIGIKYCGGCNPRYDRGKLVSQLKNDIQADLHFVSENTQNADWFIIVCGCESACAIHNSLVGKLGKIVVTSMDDYPGIVKRIKSTE